MNKTVSDFYKEVAEHTNVSSRIEIGEEYHGMPLIRGTDGEPIFLYTFLNALDSMVSYGAIISEFPELTYSQIYDIFSFIRKILQYNTSGLDVEQFEEEHNYPREELIADLRKVIASGPPTEILK